MVSIFEQRDTAPDLSLEVVGQFGEASMFYTTLVIANVAFLALMGVLLLYR
jgi:hypothetical protein